MVFRLVCAGGSPLGILETTMWLNRESIVLLAGGLSLTIMLTLLTSAVSLMVGIAVGIARLSGRPFLPRVARLYVEVFRNIPALVLIIFWAFAVPNLFPLELRRSIFFDNSLATWGGQLTGLSLPYYALAAAIGLSLNTSAYLAELFRAGVGTIPQQVLDAARSLGASPAAVFWRVLLPQGVRAAFPAITTRLIHNMKNTALASFVAVPEFFQAAQAAISRSFQAVEILVFAAVMYWLLSFWFAAMLNSIDRRLNQVA